MVDGCAVAQLAHCLVVLCSAVVGGKSCLKVQPGDCHRGLSAAESDKLSQHTSQVALLNPTTLHPDQRSTIPKLFWHLVFALPHLLLNMYSIALSKSLLQSRWACVDTVSWTAGDGDFRLGTADFLVCFLVLDRASNE